MPSDDTMTDLGFLRRLVRANQRASDRFDRLLPAAVRVDGMTDFLSNVLPRTLPVGCTVVDLGSGKTPAVSPDLKRERSLRIIGIDVDPSELARAPVGSYDEVYVADLTTWRGEPVADVAICSAVLEHVTDTAGALRAIASVLKPGGKALIFCPCRNALFARLNLLLPERIKLALLDVLYGRGHGVGFPAHYDRCTPSAFERIAADAGLEVVSLTPYYMSAYFNAIAPVHVLWRSYQACSWPLLGQNGCETFVLVATRRST